MNQAIKQAMNQAIKQAIGQATKQAISQAIKQAISQAIKQAIKQAGFPPPSKGEILAWDSSPPGFPHPPLKRRGFWPGFLPHLGSRTPL